jgi:hypothetical protein
MIWVIMLCTAAVLAVAFVMLVVASRADERANIEHMKRLSDILRRRGAILRAGDVLTLEELEEIEINTRHLEDQ